ncbi:MAG TPA: DUF4266 domain-containing protein [Polyangia bacterium]|jgi:hypothetical protein|nr:DUF4266 domain-containing protein [Polyangia bacterium]
MTPRQSQQRQVQPPSLWAVVLGIGLLLGAVGCARVAPYQRGRLAHPTMLLTDPASPGEAHIYAIQEGAVGGGSGVEGGCGCN